MSKKGNINPTEIIDSWIAIEELSEGDISLSYKSKLKSIEEVPNSWYEFFHAEIEDYLKRECKSNTSGKEGIIFYLGIFELNRLIAELKDRFNLKEDDFIREEDVKGHKFSLVFALDKNLRVDEKSIFITKSGFVIRGNDITDSLEDEEEDIKAILLPLMERKTEEEEKKGEDDNVEIAEEDFSEISEEKNNSNETSNIQILQKDYYDLKNNVDKISDKNSEEEGCVFEEFDEIFNMLIEKFSGMAAMRYKIVKNVDSELTNMHSFYVNDLNKVRKMAEKGAMTENLNRYFYGYDGERKDIQTKDIAEKGKFINKKDIEDILQPINYPCGRFPGNPVHAASLMQQMAINLSVNDIEDIMSVNGPPGTGKTTLLKEIFADLVVKQAKYISESIRDKRLNDIIKFDLGNDEVLKLAKLPHEISKHNCIVASSNNSAVQNIVSDIPKESEIFEENIDSLGKSFKELLEEVDYFSSSLNKGDEDTQDLIEEDKEGFWGLFSIEGGKSSNISKLLGIIDYVCEELRDYRVEDEDVFVNFLKKHEDVESIKEKAQKIYMQTKDKRQEIEKLHKDIESLEETKEIIFSRYRDIEKLEEMAKELSQELKILVSEKEKILSSRGLLFFVDRLARNEKYKENERKIEGINKKIVDISDEKREIEFIIEKGRKSPDELEKYKNEKAVGIAIQLSQKYESLEKKKEEMEKLQGGCKSVDFSLSYQELHRFVPWFDNEFRIKQTELFIEALRVRKVFLKSNSGYLKRAKNIFDKRNEYIFMPDGEELVTQAWNWINFTIPVISTTFASFGRMFRTFGVNSLGNLFIDEAGQALPQASVGAIMRSKKVMVVGDPYQIKPVLSVHSSLIGILEKKYNSVDETFLSTEASTQTLTDRTSKYGFVTEEENWIGLPLWVHRRCLSPMFDISNAISYNNCMVFGEAEVKVGKADWFDVKADDCEDKYVEAQMRRLKKEIDKKLEDKEIKKEDIFVITPFKNVANRLIAALDDFVIIENGKAVNIGTVHTFQGKEARIVYFVLGASKKTKGAGRWAVYEANILNVAATRAKKEFYIIGDKELYESMGCNTIEETLKVLKKFENY